MKNTDRIIRGYNYSSGLNAYRNSHDYERDSSTKAKQRKKILRFIYSHHSNNGIRYLGFPGKYWYMENRIALDAKGSKFTGIENDIRIFHQSLCMIPAKRISMRDKRYGRIRFAAVTSKECIYLNGDLGLLIDPEIREIAKESGTYTYALTNRTAAWLDFTSSFNIKTYKTLHNLKSVMNLDNDFVLCITMMYGRDLLFSEKGEKGRVQILQTAVPGFDPVKVWQYKGFNDTNMINICGVVRANTH